MREIDPLAVEPERIAISKSKGVQIDWRDGHHSEYALKYLRERCPCAQCSGAHGTPPLSEQAANPLQMYKPVLKILAVEPVGSYALRLQWSDGHSVRGMHGAARGGGGVRTSRGSSTESIAPWVRRRRGSKSG